LRVTASAPGRCGIIGNPSDIYGGFLVSCSVPLRNWCSAEVSEEDELPDDPTLWNATTERLPVGHAKVQWRSEVPRSSGLAGSTALLAAVVACIQRLRGESPQLETQEERSQFAELVRSIEQEEAGVVCGFQDAYMAVHGGLYALDFSGKHPITSGPLGKLRALKADLPFLLVTTGVERLSGSVHGPIRERWLAGEKRVVEDIERVVELGRLGALALERSDWNVLAELMTENQQITAGLGGSGEAIDHLIARCVAHGARAAKLAGAGMGGTVIALTDDADTLQKGLESDGYTRFLRPSPESGLRFESANL